MVRSHSYTWGIRGSLFGLFWLAMAVVPVAPALGEPGVALAPSGQATGCLFASGANKLAPLPPGCQSAAVLGEAPVFAPDGRSLYLRIGDPQHVLSRDPATGSLKVLPCGEGSPGCLAGSETPTMSPDGSWIYTRETNFTPARQPDGSRINVYERRSDGAIAADQCLVSEGAPTDSPECEAVLPTIVVALEVSADGSSVYVAGHFENDAGFAGPDLLTKFAVDPATGHLAVADCVSETDRAGCITDPYLSGIDKLAVIGPDLYVVVGAGHLVGYHPDSRTGKLAENGCVGFVKYRPGRCLKANGNDLPAPFPAALVPSPDGRWLYAAAPDRAVIYSFPRDPATGQLGEATCIGTTGRCSGVGGDVRSMALSPDGQTLVVTEALGNDFKGNPHDTGGRTLPGDGRFSGVFTFDLASPGHPVFEGCVGNNEHCAGPFAGAYAVAYPPSGVGPYLVSQRAGRAFGIQLLRPAPTLHVARISLTGRNPATVKCPVERSKPCRGTIEISQLVYRDVGRAI